MHLYTYTTLFIKNWQGESANPFAFLIFYKKTAEENSPAVKKLFILFYIIDILCDEIHGTLQT